jgi:ABC-type glutathione transport system ATPase component
LGAKKEIGMAVLGMSQSGKTLWYDFLSGSERGGKTQTSGGVDVDSFDLMCGKERVATIKKGTDIAGAIGILKAIMKK